MLVSLLLLLCYREVSASLSVMRNYTYYSNYEEQTEFTL